MNGGMRPGRVFRPAPGSLATSRDPVPRGSVARRIYGGETNEINLLVRDKKLPPQFDDPVGIRTRLPGAAGALYDLLRTGGRALGRALGYEEGAAGGGAEEEAGEQIVYVEPSIRDARDMFPRNQCYTTVIPFLSYYYPQLARLQAYLTAYNREGDADEFDREPPPPKPVGRVNLTQEGPLPGEEQLEGEELLRVIDKLKIAQKEAGHIFGGRLVYREDIGIMVDPVTGTSYYPRLPGERRQVAELLGESEEDDSKFRAFILRASQVQQEEAQRRQREALAEPLVFPLGEVEPEDGVEGFQRVIDLDPRSNVMEAVAPSRPAEEPAEEPDEELAEERDEELAEELAEEYYGFVPRPSAWDSSSSSSSSSAAVQRDTDEKFVAMSDMQQLRLISERIATGGKIGKWGVIEAFEDVCRKVFGMWATESLYYNDPDRPKPEKQRKPGSRKRVRDPPDEDKLDKEFSSKFEEIQRLNFSGCLVVDISAFDMRPSAVAVRRPDAAATEDSIWGHVIPFVSPPGAGCVQFFDPQRHFEAPLIALDFSKANAEAGGFVFTRELCLRLLFAGQSQNENDQGATDVVGPGGRVNFFVRGVGILRHPARILPSRNTLISRTTGGLVLLEPDNTQHQLDRMVRPDQFMATRDFDQLRPIGRAQLARYYYTPTVQADEDYEEENPRLARNLDDARRLIYSGRPMDVTDPPILRGQATPRNLNAILFKPPATEMDIMLLRRNVYTVIVDTANDPLGTDAWEELDNPPFASRRAAEDNFFRKIRYAIEQQGYYLKDDIKELPENAQWNHFSDRSIPREPPAPDRLDVDDAVAPVDAPEAEAGLLAPMAPLLIHPALLDNQGNFLGPAVNQEPPPTFDPFDI
jgi:hypothetical protein